LVDRSDKYTLKEGDCRYMLQWKGELRQPGTKVWVPEEHQCPQQQHGHDAVDNDCLPKKASGSKQSRKSFLKIIRKRASEKTRQTSFWWVRAVGTNCVCAPTNLRTTTQDEGRLERTNGRRGGTLLGFATESMLSNDNDLLVFTFTIPWHHPKRRHSPPIHRLHLEALISSKDGERLRFRDGIEGWSCAESR
jgi:hypothetical protein